MKRNPFKIFVIFMLLSSLYTRTSASVERILDFPLKIGIIPVVNESDVKIYPNKYEIRDVLGEEATKMMLRYFRRFNRLKIHLLPSLKENEDPYEKYEDMDFVLQSKILSCIIRKGETLGTNWKATLELEIKLLDIKEEKIVFERVILGTDNQVLPYLEDKERKTWKEVEKGALGGALRKVIFEGANLVARYLPLRGRIIAVLDEKRFLINLGEEDGLRKNDTLYLIRSKSVKTIDPKRPVVLIPQRLFDLQVKELKAHEAIVEIIRVRDSEADPPKEGDIVERPLYP
ncbi:MAG: hypothetical protein N3C62_06415 [Synergistetes bacterium]|nr:hypothetical protein [Synergistota bacterium]MCX8128347.1 hypothetical protein [Synergistota bacterium]MDW8192995.1 FlgT C-terminal domain-containing protein [Synergistota bacterium]